MLGCLAGQWADAGCGTPRLAAALVHLADDQMILTR
jgi:hypothetical protein